VAYRPVVRQRLRNKQPLLSNGSVAVDTHAVIEELLEALFSVRSVPRLYNEGQLQLRESLETALRSVGGRCEMAASLGVSHLEQ
jgi:hypothetical protein